jgi:hypothetical protein
MIVRTIKYFGTSYYFWGYYLLCYILTELSLRKIGKMKAVTPEDVARDKKYLPFYVPGTWIGESLYARFVLLIFVPLLPPRICLGYGATLLNSLFMMFLGCLGGSPGNYSEL